MEMRLDAVEAFAEHGVILQDLLQCTVQRASEKKNQPLQAISDGATLLHDGDET